MDGMIRENKSEELSTDELIKESLDRISHRKDIIIEQIESHKSDLTFLEKELDKINSVFGSVICDKKTAPSDEEYRERRV